jgi:hypothetical protein
MGFRNAIPAACTPSGSSRGSEVAATDADVIEGDAVERATRIGEEAVVIATILEI